MRTIDDNRASGNVLKQHSRALKIPARAEPAQAARSAVPPPTPTPVSKLGQYPAPPLMQSQIRPNTCARIPGETEKPELGTGSKYATPSTGYTADDGQPLIGLALARRTLRVLAHEIGEHRVPADAFIVSLPEGRQKRNECCLQTLRNVSSFAVTIPFSPPKKKKIIILNMALIASLQLPNTIPPETRRCSARPHRRSLVSPAVGECKAGSRASSTGARTPSLPATPLDGPVAPHARRGTPLPRSRAPPRAASGRRASRPHRVTHNDPVTGTSAEVVRFRVEFTKIGPGLAGPGN